MRVAELTGVREFRVVDRELPEPGPGEVQVRVDSIGICGSDVHSYAEGAVGDTPAVYPMVLGHEPAGVAVKVGGGVSGIEPGDRGAFEPAIYCYHCEYCLSGRHNICARLRFMSSPGDPGYFRERANIPAESFLPVPRRMKLETATLIEPLAVALHSLQFAAMRLGETAAVFGAGPIGLLTVIALKASGAGRVWVVEPVAHRRELALKAGADAAIDPHAVEAGREIQRETGKRGVDAAIDCAAKEDTLAQAVESVRNGGRVVLTGIHAVVEAPLNFHRLRRKEIALYNVRRSNHESGQARDLITANESRFAELITHEWPLEGIGQAFALVEGFADGVGKLVIKT